MQICFCYRSWLKELTLLLDFFTEYRPSNATLQEVSVRLHLFTAHVNDTKGKQVDLGLDLIENGLAIPDVKNNCPPQDEY